MPIAFRIVPAYLPLIPTLSRHWRGWRREGPAKGLLSNLLVATVVQTETEWPIWRA